MVKLQKFAKGKKKMHNNMWWPKEKTLNNGSMVKDLFIKHEGERRWKVQTFSLAP
jgi:hypothetical protein